MIAPLWRALGLGLGLLGGPLAAQDGAELRAQIIAAGAAAGVTITPQLSANRGFPPCPAPVTITASDAAWSRVTLSCPAGWTRVIRTDATPSAPLPRADAPGPGLTTPAVVLTESLPRGTVLQPHHLTRTLIAAHGQTDLVQALDSAIGRGLRSNLGAGQPLLGRHLAPDTAVRRDRPVTITISAAPILIEASGIAIEDGQIGQDIRVRNTSSDRIVHVTVTGPNKVAVQPNIR